MSKIICSIILMLFISCNDSINDNSPLNKSIHLLKPNGGEIYQLSDTINVSWEYENVNEFNLLFSIDGGNSWTKIAENLENISEYNYLYAETIESDSCLVKIENFADNSIFDVSDKYFSIEQNAKPELRIFSEYPSNYTNKSPLSFSSDDEFLYSYSPDIWGDFFPTNIWDINTGQLVNKIPTSFLSSSPSQNILVGYNLDQDSVGLWEPMTSAKLESFPTWYPFDAKVSHNGKYLAIARTRWVDVWDVETMEHLHNITVREYPSEDNFHTIEFSPDDKIIASANDKLRLYNVLTGSKIKEINRGQAFSIKFYPDGSKIVAGGVYGIINIWDIETGEKILEFNADEERVFSIDIAPNGEKLLIGTRGELLLWNLVNNSQDTLIYNSGIANFLGVAYSNNSKYVAGKVSDKIVIYGPMK